MKNFAPTIESGGHLGLAKGPDNFSARGSSSHVSHEMAERELREGGEGKASMLELLIDRLVDKLTLQENYDVIDQAVGEDGAAQELADRLLRYAHRLGTKNISPNNSAVDVMCNFNANMLGFVERAKKKGLAPYKNYIAEGFNLLEDYLELLEEHHDFEKAELSSDLGYLKPGIDPEELKRIRSDKRSYIERLKEAFDKNNTEHNPVA